MLLFVWRCAAGGYFLVTYSVLPVVPHKAVAEVSE